MSRKKKISGKGLYIAVYLPKIVLPKLYFLACVYALVLVHEHMYASDARVCVCTNACMCMRNTDTRPHNNKRKKSKGFFVMERSTICYFLCVLK